MLFEKIDRFLWVSSDHLSSRTLETYSYYLKNMAEWLEENDVIEPRDVDEKILRCWLDSHPRWGRATRRLASCALRSFFKWVVADLESPAAKIRISRPKPRPQRTLDELEVQKLLASCDTATIKGTRDVAMIALMLDTGLRASEICRLERGDLAIDKRHLTVEVKGGETGYAIFSTYTANLLAAWICMREQIAAEGEKAVFASIGGNRSGTAMTRDGLRANLYKLSDKVGIRRASPHTLRRTFATLSLKGGAPSRLVQVAGRWSNLNMVERYSQALRPEDFEPYSPVNRIMGLNEDSLNSN